MSIGVVPAIFVTLLLVAFAVGLGASQRPPASPSPAVVSFRPTPGVSAAIPTVEPEHKFAAADENTFIGSCVADLPASDVPPPVAQAFCVCTLNTYEDMYPTYRALNDALASGALTDQTRSSIASRCVTAILGG